MSAQFQILTDSMLAALPQALRMIGSAKYRRAGCPFNGSDKVRSLSLNTEIGRWHCYACGAKGYTEQAHAEWQARKDAERPDKKTVNNSRTQTSQWSAPGPKVAPPLRLRADAPEPEQLPADWLKRFTDLQARLPEAAEYVTARGILLELVRGLGGAVGIWVGPLA